MWSLQEARVFAEFWRNMTHIGSVCVEINLVKIRENSSTSVHTPEWTQTLSSKSQARPAVLCAYAVRGLEGVSGLCERVVFGDAAVDADAAVSSGRSQRRSGKNIQIQIQMPKKLEVAKRIVSVGWKPTGR